MLGYIQSNSPVGWAEKIKAGLKEGRKVSRLIGEWLKAEYVKDFEHCYVTVHERSRTKRTLTVYHTLLSFN